MIASHKVKLSQIQSLRTLYIVCFAVQAGGRSERVARVSTIDVITVW